MIGSSRESLAACQEGLDGLRQEAGFDLLADELFSVAALLDGEGQLRSLLADSGQPAAVRDGLVHQLFADRVGALAVRVLAMVIDRRWSTDVDLVVAIELLAAQAAFTGAEADGTLDATEEELFLFGRALDSSPALQMALTDPSQSPQTKSSIVRDLLGGRATASTASVLQYAVGHLHGRRIDAVVEDLGALAARQRERVVAEVRVAAPLDEAQEQRLSGILSRLKGRTVQLNVAVDPSVLGGVHVRIGDEVIDGTVASRMEQARRAIIG
ncbi:MAG: F0F1 ATP synthase subunit delta [Actinomycetota bacterium]|nr:F0F1 ATP synthase subunit delta [Actinomycetota bacterium]